MKKRMHFGASYTEVEVGDIVQLATDRPMKLDSGQEIRNFPLAYQTYGALNAERSNAIMVCHGLTGDQYALGKHPVTAKNGWWQDLLIGPGLPIDTDRYFVIAANVIGGCLGSFGPKEVNPETGKPYNLDFPVITIHDMVRALSLLLDHLGIDSLLSIIGGSMGGMQALSFAIQYPDRVRSVIPMATAARHTAQNIAFHEIGRQAIMADPEWRGGHYLNERTYPSKGLAVARMAAHVTYMSETNLGQKFGRNLQGREAISFGFDADFQVESYLRHQGMTFVERFDPNSYLYITRAMDYFDLTHGQPGKNDAERLSHVFKPTRAKFCIISFSSDWLFPSSESKMIVHALNSVSAGVSFVEINTDKGHDAFLLDEPELRDTVRGFLKGIK